MTDATHSFDDSAGYERFVGRWGRTAGSAFLAWVAPPASASWLDVGCGTGLFTELVLNICAPRAVMAIDPAQAQIDHARRKPTAQGAEFRVADAQELPFADGAFDVVASALVINFIPDRRSALDEMQRVVRRGGIVAGYVWDFVPERSPSGPFRLGMREVVSGVPAIPGTEDSTLDALTWLFNRAGLRNVMTASFEVPVSFVDFDAFWEAQTPSYSPTTKMLAGMEDSERKRVQDAVRARLSIKPDGRIEYTARANAVKAVAPA